LCLGEVTFENVGPHCLEEYVVPGGLSRNIYYRNEAINIFFWDTPSIVRKSEILSLFIRCVSLDKSQTPTALFPVLKRSVLELGTVVCTCHPKLCKKLRSGGFQFYTSQGKRVCKTPF
jgi:hypothetical protein